MTKLASKLPKDTDDNGLDTLRRKLIADPADTHTIVAVIDCSKLETDTDSGYVEPTVRILRVEAVTDADLADTNAMFRRAHAKRTGKTVVDTSTGEVLDQ